ncbi:MAG TPA: hypothetical protein VI384_04395 [Candidatus Dormibacteraeota bacterium]
MNADDEETVDIPPLTNAQLAQEWAVAWGIREIFETRDKEDDDEE